MGREFASQTAPLKCVGSNNKAATEGCGLEYIWDTKRLQAELAAQQARHSKHAGTKQHHAARLRSRAGVIGQARESAIQPAHRSAAEGNRVLQHQLNLVAAATGAIPAKVTVPVTFKMSPL